MTPSSFTLTLQSVRSLAPNVKHFSFIPADEKIVSFIPGQFIRIAIPSNLDKPVSRSYSIANSGEASDHNRLEFAASYIPQGLASEFLFNMNPGDTLEATGPFGRLILPPPEGASSAGEPSSPAGGPSPTQVELIQRYILIATGTGVTPYRSMLPELARRMHAQATLEVILLLGVRTPEEALYREEFVKFSHEHPQFQFRVYYSRIKEAPTSSDEHSGYVSKAFDTIIAQPESDIVYLCGNPNMVDDIFKYLTTQGFSSRRIRREKYI